MSKRRKRQKNKRQEEPQPNLEQSMQKATHKRHWSWREYFSEREKRLEQVEAIDDPMSWVGFYLTFFYVSITLWNFSAYSERVAAVPIWLTYLQLAAGATNALMKILWGIWLIFVLEHRVWLRIRTFLDWAFIVVTLFFYFYGTGLYNATLLLLSTTIFPFLSETVNTIIANVFGWVASGILGNAAYDLLKRLVSKYISKSSNPARR